MTFKDSECDKAIFVYRLGIICLPTGIKTEKGLERVCGFIPKLTAMYAVTKEIVAPRSNNASMSRLEPTPGHSQHLRDIFFPRAEHWSDLLIQRKT